MNVFRPLTSFAGAASRPTQSLRLPFTRAFSSTQPSARFQPRDSGDDVPAPDFGQDLSKYLDSARNNGSSDAGPPKLSLDNLTRRELPHRLHIYATKHNTHITFTQPPKQDPANPGKQIDVLLSLSAGNIGFKKSGRGSYDAAYQLAAFTLKQIQERGLLRELKNLEVVLRGFGKGREAVTKALLGSEGYILRNKITTVKDATRLKFGGTRSPKPRRLG